MRIELDLSSLIEEKNLERDAFRKEVRVIEHNFYFYIGSSIFALVLLIAYTLIMTIGYSGYVYAWFPIPMVFLGGYIIYGISVLLREYRQNKMVFDVWHDSQGLLDLLQINRWKAAIALAHFTNDDGVVLALTNEMMDNTNWLIRKWSAWALGYTKEKKSIKELIEVCQYDSAPEVRENAIQSLMNMGSAEDAYDQLKVITTTDPIRYVRRKARKAIVNLDDVELQ